MFSGRRKGLTEPSRKIAGDDLIPLAERRCGQKRLFELAYIPRPGKGLEHIQSFRGKGQGIFSLLLNGCFVQEMDCQKGNIFNSLTQRRHFDFDAAERKKGFGKTSIIVSAASKSKCRLCVSELKIFPFWQSIS